MSGGRPTDYTQELADLICAEIADGKSMRTICAQIGMPHMVTVFRWLRSRDEFCKQYTKAKEESADAMIEDMIEIADLPPPLTVTGCVDGGAVQHARLRVETRKWISSKLKPKKYGDKLDLTSDGDKLPAPPSVVCFRLVE
jgi:hypothetical protein